MSLCPACAESIVVPYGNVSNEFLIIEEFPECSITPNKYAKQSEIHPQDILSRELSKVGMYLQQFRIVSVFPHPVPSNGMPDERCYNYGMELVLNEIQGKRGVIVLGSNLCKCFTGYEHKSVSGLSEVPSQYLPDMDVVRVFLPNVRTIYVNGAGEFSLGLKRFAKQLGVYNERPT